jgi:hypothetical protein
MPNAPRRPRRDAAPQAQTWDEYRSLMANPRPSQGARVPILDLDPLALDAPDSAPRTTPDPNNPAVYDAAAGVPRWDRRDEYPEPGETVRLRR